MSDLAAFSDSYAEARRKFVEAARRAGAKLSSYQHPDERGPGGEALFLDVAVLGPGDAARVFVNDAGMRIVRTTTPVSDWPGFHD